MRIYILTILCMALVLGVVAGCATPQSNVPTSAPRPPAAVKTDEVCTYIADYADSIDQALVIMAAAQTEKPIELRKSADDMGVLAATFGGYYIPLGQQQIGARMRLVLSTYAQALQTGAGGNSAGMMSGEKVANRLMMQVLDDAHALRIQHGCK
jgi:hypothetical protein